MAQAGIALGHTVIDLSSDSDSEDDGRQVEASVIDLTNIPDIDIPPNKPRPMNDQSHGNPDRGGGVGLITEAACLQMVLDVLPAISVDYVLNLIQNKTTDQTRSVAQCEQIILQLLEGTHPTEADAVNQKKRKREDEDENISRMARGEYRQPCFYENDALNILKDEFLNVPVRHITNVFEKHKTLLKAYEALEDQNINYQPGISPFVRLKKARGERNSRPTTTTELQAARRNSNIKAAKRRELKESEQAEEANLQQAQLNKEMGECQCCFSEYPLNRMVSCNGNGTHRFCFDCFKQYVQTEMGQSHCRPVCFATENCHGLFSRQQLTRVLDKRTFDRLEHMQQQQDLEAAGLDFLSECPFCDFKMECPPVEIDREFRCQNNKCHKTSCRLCQKETHIPFTCNEAMKDERLTLRHVVEEAMSAALIRTCNRCKHHFVKDYGCNKMTCSHCRNVQCYVCSKNVLDYNHFSEGGSRNTANGSMCPLHDDVEARHEQEVKKAADATMAKVKADNPGLSDTDLMIEVSDRVKRGGAAQRAQHAEELAIPNPPPAPQYVQPHPFHHLVAAPVPFPLPLPNYPYRPPAPQAIWHPPQAIQHPTQGQGFVYPPRHNYHRHYQHPHQPNHRF